MWDKKSQFPDQKQQFDSSFQLLWKVVFQSARRDKTGRNLRDRFQVARGIRFNARTHARAKNYVKITQHFTTCTPKGKLLVLQPRSYLLLINFSKLEAGASERLIWQAMNNFLYNLCHLYEDKNKSPGKASWIESQRGNAIIYSYAFPFFIAFCLLNLLEEREPTRTELP